MAVTPPIFAAAAQWAQARPYGCAAGQAVRDVLLQLTGPPRVAACTLSAPVPLRLSHVVPVRATWPVTQPGIDVCFLIHRGTPPPRVRSRMAEGPALFLHVERAADVHPGLIAEEDLLAARVRILRGELRALALRHPTLGGALRRVAALAPGEGPGPTRPAVAVIGPDAAAARSLGRELAAEFSVRESGDVDAVVAVAAPEGWSAADTPTLHDALSRVGRLISTAPPPAGIPASGVTVARNRAEIPGLLHQLLARPRAGATPAAEPGGWRRAMGHLRRNGATRLEREVKGCTQTSQLAEVARRHGLGPLPERGLLSRLGPLLVAGLAGAGVARLLWPLSTVFAVVMALVVAVVAGAARWRQAERRWLREAAVELRQRWAEPDITSGRGSGPVGWVRQQLMVGE